ncbi:MAG TPA: hypothetical protein VFQ72_01015 [Candidatus Paceibacterota bacterium]|nr:hypothetical protein [Candidatus Paceibacterota bacterium]
MKNKLIVLGLIAVLGVVGFMISARRSEISIYPNDANAGMDMLESTSDSAENIDIGIEPVDLASSEWVFEVSLNTHTGSLDQDLTRSANIVSDDGRVLEPLRWEGDPEGGHHRSGKLIFKALDPRPRSILLKISGFGGRERSYPWELNQ